MPEKEKPNIKPAVKSGEGAWFEDVGAQRHNVDKYAGFRAYVEGRQKAIFNEVNALYKSTRAAMKLGDTVPTDISPLLIVMDCDNWSEGRLASNNGTRMWFHQRSYKMYSEMKAAEAHGDKYMWEELKYHIDKLIAHELGHLLTNSAFFSNDPFFRSRGSSRRQSDGISELIGFYVAQKVNGKPTDNASVANAMLTFVRQKQEEIAEFNAIVSAQWSSLTSNEKKEKQKDILAHTRRTVYYDYAVLGIAEALKSNQYMSMQDLIKAVLTEPDSLSGIDGHIMNISGNAAGLEDIDNIRRLYLAPSGPVYDEDALKELKLQSALSALMLKEVGTLLKIAVK